MSDLDLNVEDALDFYRHCILDETKKEYYSEYGFSYGKAIPPKNWEVFAAILLRDRCKPGDGADLYNYEVKSAKIGNSYEYQYHKLSGQKKLEEERHVDHVFIARSADYRYLEVWLVEKERLLPMFDRWLPQLIENYQSELRQRFRRSVSYNFVTRNGTMIFRIDEGQQATVIDQPELA